MDDYVYRLTLDLNCNKNTPIINSAQFDKGRKIHLTVTANGDPFSLSDCSVVMKGVHADKTHLLLDCDVENDGTAIVSTEDTTFSVAGLTVCKLVISNSQKTYSTQKFLVQVESSLDSDITADERYSVLDRLIRQIQLIDEVGGIAVDDELDETSEHPVQNKVVKNKFVSLEDNVNGIKNTLTLRESLTDNCLVLPQKPVNPILKTKINNEKTDLGVVVGGKNLICYPYANANTRTHNGITYTVNESDKSITANGTATGDSSFNISQNGLPSCFPKRGNGKYGGYLSGCTGGSAQTFYIAHVSSGHKQYNDPFLLESSVGLATGFQIVIKSGVTVTNKVFRPMFSVAPEVTYDKPATLYRATVESGTEEYTWQNIVFRDGLNTIVPQIGDSVDLTTDVTFSAEQNQQDLNEITAEIEAVEADSVIMEKQIEEIEAESDNIMDYINNSLAFLSIGNRFKFSNVFASSVTNGITVTRIGDNLIKLNGTATDDFNINFAFGSFKLDPLTLFYRITCSDGDNNNRFYLRNGYIDANNVHTQLGSIETVNEWVELTYPTSANKSRLYLKVFAGAVFADTIIGFYAVPEYIERRLDNFQNFLTTETISFVDGFGVEYTTGEIVSNDTYSYVELNISIFAGETITGYSGASDYMGIAFYDGAGNFISGFGNSVAGTYNWDINGIIPINATTARIHCKKTHQSSFNITYRWNKCLQNIQDGIKLARTSKLDVERINERINPANLIEHELYHARHIMGNSSPPLTILHFSDLHGDRAAITRIVNKSEKYSDSIDEMICTGDMVGSLAADITPWWIPDIMTCIGNHDCASHDGVGYNWTALSMADRDAYYIAPFENSWGAIVHTTGTSYYYKDYIEQNVRLIVMDCMLYNDNGNDAATQTDWLESLLSDAINSNLHVLIAIHAPHGGAIAKECSFSRYGQTAMPTNNDCNTPDDVINAVAAAITGGLHFVGYICGHTHQDNIWDVAGDGTQMMYCVTCAAVSYAPQWQNSDQYRDDKNDAFNLITIDTAHTLVKIVRGGGADIDDHMRTRKAICFDYSTGTLVGEVL